MRSRGAPHNEVIETANEVVDVTIESASEVGNGLRMNLRNALFDPVDLEIGHPKFRSEFGTRELASLAEPLDSLSNAGWFLHDPRVISGPDISRPAVSNTDTQGRDNVSQVELKAPRDLTVEEVERWAMRLGYVRADGKLDHESMVKDAGVGPTVTWAVIKQKWNNPRPEQKSWVIDSLLRRDREQRAMTIVGARIAAHDEWIELGAKIVWDMDTMRAQLVLARAAAAEAAKKAAARQVAIEAGLEVKPEEGFGTGWSPVDPKKPRK